MDKKYWFKRMPYGYGWIPAAKEGWTVLAGYLVIVLGGSLTIINVPSGQFTKELGFYLLVVLLASTALIKICLKKGPKPKWRWGKKYNDNPFEDW